MAKDYVKLVLEQAQETNEALENKIGMDQRRLRKSITNLEKKIVSEFSQLSTSDLGNLLGPKVNLKKAQHLQKRLVKLFEEEYGKTVRSSVEGYSEISGWIDDNFKELDVIAKFTDVDKTMMNQLAKQNLLEFTNIGVQAQTRISQAMYNLVSSGAMFDDLVKEIRGALTGHKDARGQPLSKYAELYANDGIMNYYNSVHVEKGREAGLRHMLYVGDIIATTRDFCTKRAMKVYTVTQINSWTHNWQGKRGPALTYRGGWNCRHHWKAVKKEWIDDLRQRYGEPVAYVEAIEAPKGFVKPEGGRGWNEFSKSDRSKLSRMRTKMMGGYTFEANSARVKFWWGELNDAERNAFVQAWQSEGIDVSPAFLKKGEKVIKPVVKPKPEPKPVVKPKPEPDLEGGSVVEPVKPKEVVKPTPSKGSPEELKEKYLALEAKYKETSSLWWKKGISFDEIEKLGDEVFDAKVDWVNTLSGKELQKERKKIVESLLRMDSSYPSSVRRQAIKYIELGTEHIPYRLLADMERRGLYINYTNSTGRAHFISRAEGEINIFGKAPDIPATVAHEMGHAIDWFLSSNARGFGGFAGRWSNTIYATAKEADQYNGWFQKQLLPSKVTKDYGNGDGKYWVGKFINNYEARIYKGQGKHPQFFSMACERYHNAFRNYMSNRFDNQIENIKKGLKLSTDALKEFKPSDSQYRHTLSLIKIRREELRGLFPAGKSYEQAKWDWAFNYGKWKKQKKFYPEYAGWMEGFFERINKMSGRSKYNYGFVHKQKEYTLSNIKEINKMESQIQSFVEKI